MAHKKTVMMTVTGVETRNLPAMPIHVEFQRMGADVSLTDSRVEPTFSFKWKEPSQSMDEYWQEFKRASLVGRALFSVKTPLEALAFFEATGFFLLGNGPRGDEGWKETVTWREFQLWQKLLRFISQHGFLSILDSRDWPEYDKEWTIMPWRTGAPKLPPELEPIIISAPHSTKDYLSGEPKIRMHRDERLAEVQNRKPKLEMSIFPFGTVEAVLSSLFIDQQTGIQYKLCGRGEKCGQLFVANDARRKQYCSQKCAHHANVTRDREKKAETKAEEKKVKKKGVGKSNG